MSSAKPYIPQFGKNSFLSIFGLSKSDVSTANGTNETNSSNNNLENVQSVNKKSDSMKNIDAATINNANLKNELTNINPSRQNTNSTVDCSTMPSKTIPKTTKKATKRKKIEKIDDERPEYESKFMKSIMNSRILPIASGEESTFQPVCIAIGHKYNVGHDTFLSNKMLYATEMKDYTLITDAIFDVSQAPHEIKPLLEHRWIYKLHVNPTLSPVITRSVLRDRVVGGQILAYRYTECSIDGNNCVYYGFLPTIYKEFPDSHDRCYIASQEIWPRKLYIYLKSTFSCNCSPGCVSWSSNMYDYTTVRSFCMRKIKWPLLYIMMGDVDRKCTEVIKELRSCEVCAQCFNCSNSMQFCRKHKVCRHKTAKPLKDVISIVQSKMKMCTRYK